jgi:hypothetical protein
MPDNESYILGRKKYGRPQAMLFSDNPGVISENGLYVPSGTENTNFIVLSDDNRSDISIRENRIETRKRMVNGNMRSHHIADKVIISTSWDMLPSRSSSTGPVDLNAYSYTSDHGAGGVQLLDWYAKNAGSFWVFLAYDKYSNFASQGTTPSLQQYNEVIEVYFSDFSYTVKKRGHYLHDYWSIDLSLEEV